MDTQSLTEDLEERLRVEYLDDARDRLDAMDRAIDAAGKGTRSDAEAIGVVRMESHTLKGMSASFGYPSVGLIAHRLEDYLRGLPRLGDRETAEVQAFLDRIAELLDRKEQPDLAETNRIIRALPVRYRFEVTAVEVRDVEVMLVTPSKVVARKVGTELAACGFRVVTMSDPVEALGVAVRVPPDLLVASLVMDGLSGLDLIRSLRTIGATRDVPMALLTSMGLDAPALKEVPPGVAIVRVGDPFADDVAAAVARFNLG